MDEYRERYELKLLRETHHAEEDQFRSVEDRRRKDLEEKMAELEASSGAIKMPLSSIDRYISEK
jgi:CRISPR/Cas system type I-B associated protein Csh2 (Cas7 group RAMP superfamily)